MIPWFATNIITLLQDTQHTELANVIMGTDIVYKTIYLENIDDERITDDDIIQLFGLAATPFLQKHTSVKTALHAGVRYATIILPECVSNEVTKLNGVKMYGKKIKVSETFTGNNENNGENNSNSSNNSSDSSSSSSNNNNSNNNNNNDNDTTN
jgi:hypothetical protein